MRPTLNGTTITPFSEKDFEPEEWGKAKLIIKEIENCGIPLGKRKEFILSRLSFYKVSMTCLMTLQNEIDRQNLKHRQDLLRMGYILTK